MDLTGAVILSVTLIWAASAVCTRLGKIADELNRTRALLTDALMQRDTGIPHIRLVGGTLDQMLGLLDKWLRPQ